MSHHVFVFFVASRSEAFVGATTMRRTMPHEYTGAHGILWKDKLLGLGGVDLLKDTLLDSVAQNSEYPCWLIEVPDVLSPDSLRAIGVELGSVLQQPAHSQQVNDMCHVIHASRSPCTCEYRDTGAGQKTHVFVYGTPGSVVKLPTGKRRLRQLDNIMTYVTSGLASKCNLPAECLPTYVVGDIYSHSSACIGYRSLDGKLFGAHSEPTVMFSLNVNGDGIFVITPNIQDPTIKTLFEDESKIMDCELAFLASENSMIVMGGWFQKVFMHRTMSHDSIVDDEDDALHPKCDPSSDGFHFQRARYIREDYLENLRLDPGKTTPQVVGQ